MKPRLIYVDKKRGRLDERNDPDIVMERQKRVTMVNGYLDSRFDVDFFDGLNRGAVKIIVNDLRNGEEKYVAMVSHFPQDPSFHKLAYVKKMPDRDYLVGLYGESASLIKEMRKEFPKFPMIAYSGVSAKTVPENMNNNVVDIVREAGFNDMVWKSNDAREDAVEILAKLEKLLGKC